jgi:hypothetical protein
MRIFISYVTRDHRDRALAQRIRMGLKARAVEMVYAPQSIRGGGMERGAALGDSLLLLAHAGHSLRGVGRLEGSE